ncbi:MAG: RagB/SusD family nutrient uptake outer membrane protein [Tannerella sp.]|nr:RagB/SusD family nutrient uptake outer membrane protein [Tannerella sp.]
MKKYILLSVIVMGGFSCTDSFLEEKMVATITQDYFNTEIGLEQLIVGTYDAFRVSKQYYQGPATFLCGVDNFNSKVANQALFSASEWNSSGTIASRANNLCGEYTSNSLLGYYPIINNCNRAIQTIRNNEALGKFAEDQAHADLRLSEALFNRAYALYILNTMYGDVYIPEGYTTELPGNYNYVRQTSENIYKLIIGDLRFAFENLPDVNELNLANEYGRATKGAAAHFLAKLYLQRAQGARYGSTEYGRQADGSIDNTNEKSYLGMLYKGNAGSDLDSCIFFASRVINHGYYQLESDYAKLFSHPLDDYSNETSREIIQSALYATSENGRYGNRILVYIGAGYTNAAWGIPDFVWEGPTKVDPTGLTNDFGYDLYVNKHADSRYQKSFHVEFKTALRGGSSTTSGSPNEDYYAYNNSSNATVVWTKEMADYFNEYIRPTYTRESWGGRLAVEGEHKIGKGDLAFAYVENTKETALDINEALGQPFVVLARWLKDGNNYYYRAPIQTANSTYSYNNKSYAGLDKTGATTSPGSLKYDDPNRASFGGSGGTRDIPVFRLAETYLLRAEAYGRKGDYGSAVQDINTIRMRAAFKSGENRAEVLARLQPGHENLTETEQQWPYTVEKDMTNEMMIDATYWDGTSENSGLENYPATASGTEDRFVNFILNELARELNNEMIYYENLHHSGWQADRIIYHNQMASSLKGLWDVADNLIGGQGQLGDGKGFYKPHYTLKPFAQSVIDLLTDENGKLLDETGKKAYQNYGY